MGKNFLSGSFKEKFTEEGVWTKRGPVKLNENGWMFLLLILLMADILHQLVGGLSHYLHGFIHLRWCRISAINSTNKHQLLKSPQVFNDDLAFLGMMIFFVETSWGFEKQELVCWRCFKSPSKETSKTIDDQTVLVPKWWWKGSGNLHQNGPKIFGVRTVRNYRKFSQIIPITKN